MTPHLMPTTQLAELAQVGSNIMWLKDVISLDDLSQALQCTGTPFHSKLHIWLKYLPHRQINTYELTETIMDILNDSL